MAVEPLQTATTTWNDAERIAAHRVMSPSQRLRLTIEASRATLLFTNGRRVEHDERVGVRA